MDDKAWSNKLEADLANGREGLTKARLRQLPGEYQHALALGLELQRFDFSVESTAREDGLRDLMDHFEGYRSARWPRLAVLAGRSLVGVVVLALLLWALGTGSPKLAAWWDQAVGHVETLGEQHPPVPLGCNQIVFSYGTFSRNGIERNIVSTCPDGTEKRRLTVDGMGNWSPAWSPDGVYIAFISGRNGVPELLVMDEDGENVRQLIPDLEIWDAIWFPRGDRIGIQTPAGGGEWAWQSVDVTTGEVNSIDGWNRESFFQPWDFSNDGTRLAYSAGIGDGERPARQIRVRDIDGSNEYPLTSGSADNIQAAWSPDDRQIAFLSDASRPPGGYDLYIVSADGSDLRRIEAPDLAEPRSSFAWSPDGQSMAIYDGISLYTLDLATGSIFTLFTIDEPNYMSGVTWQP